MPHGGMLSEAARLYPTAPRPFIDLSTGINPVPYPLPHLPETAFTRLPDADDDAALREVAAQTYGVSDPAMVAAAPGTQILISLLPYLLSRANARVAILSPTYGEHAASWTAAGCTVLETTDIADLAQADIAVVCNPNNPDGRRHTPHDLIALANGLATRKGLLIVDEAFADLEPKGLSLAGALPHPAILILRSFGKSYGLAGLRLGFALTNPERADHIRAALGPWSVSGPSLAAALTALPDEPWRQETVHRLDADAARLDAIMKPSGMVRVGGTRLFHLYEGANASGLHDRLARAGILVRRFLGQPQRLRFGLPADVDEWERLRSTLHK